MTIALMYHDVVPSEADDDSGFPGQSAAHYKVTPQQFDEHLDRLAEVTTAMPAASPSDLTAAQPWLLTFDDGGISAITAAADRLEARGWRGWFFMTTDRLDTPTFLSKSQLRELRQRGHVIGSHSCSHPLRMSYCSPTQLFDEWSRSRRVLEDVLGEEVRTASVPGGFYSPAVGQAAALAGLTTLFTSEPTTHSWQIGDCTLYGRYTITRGMSADDAAALASSPWRRSRQACVWTAKKLVKRLGGTAYLQVREQLFRRGLSPA